MHHVIVSGPMGAGKSTLTAGLARKLEFTPYLESDAEGNPFLERFYADMPRWALASQLHFVTEAARQHQQITRDRFAGAVQDRSVWEHLGIFAAALHRAGHLTDSELTLLEQTANLACYRLPAPALLIHLPASYELICERISERGRDYEQTIDHDYLREHCAMYPDWVQQFSVCPVVHIDPARYDFRDETDLAAVAEIVTTEFRALERGV